MDIIPLARARTGTHPFSPRNAEALKTGPARRPMRGPNLTLEDAARAYLNACKVRGNVAAWHYQQGVILQDFISHLAREGVNQLARAEGHHLYSFLALCQAKGNGAQTLHRKGIIIRAWSRWAERTGLIKAGTLARVDLKAPPPAPMDLDSFHDILALVLKCWKVDFRDAFLLLIASGLRRGELLALRWQDCDFAAGLLHVRPQRNGWTPKTKRPRAAGIPPWAVEILTRRKQTQGGAGPFQDAEGKPIMDPSTLSHGWARLARQHGCPHLRLHDLRHSHATEALERGATIREVQEQLGHRRVTTTERYTHVNRKSAARVGGLFADALPTEDAG